MAIGRSLFLRYRAKHHLVPVVILGKQWYAVRRGARICDRTHIRPSKGKAIKKFW